MLWILVLLLLIFMIAGAPSVGWVPHSYGYGPSGILGVVIFIIIVLLLLRLL